MHHPGYDPMFLKKQRLEQLKRTHQDLAHQLKYYQIPGTAERMREVSAEMREIVEEFKKKGLEPWTLL